MGLCHKKNKEGKNVSFWKRGREQQEKEILSEAMPVTEEEAAEEDLREESAWEDAEQDALRLEAIQLARQAAEEARAALAETEEADEPIQKTEDSASEEPGKIEEPEESEAAEEVQETKAFEKITEESETSKEIELETEEISEEPEDAEAFEEQPEKMSIFARIREGLKKTKDAMMSRLQQVLGSFTKIDDDLFEELEETLIMSDLGPETSVQICETLRSRVKERNVTDPNEIMGMIQEIMSEMLGEDQALDYSTKQTVIMVIGVNGAGKTTTIGKLCHQLKSEGKKVLVAAADTFRAAAIDQLEVWTQRAGVDIVKHAEGSDPASVVYDAIEAAKARNCDVLICDTAGRLHNKKNLMQELAKINRIIANKAEDWHREILLVLDATTGQNAVNQARLFQEVADISGIVLTKLDGTAKGGIVVSIHNELGIPVKLIGVGEKMDDLQPFCREDFVRALFAASEEA